MAKTIEINHGVQTFDEHIDTSRNNPDRKQWGRGDTDFHIGEEYDQPTPQADTTPPPAPPTKFTHKLSNGTVLEADSVEALAAKIEKSVQTIEVEHKWDETPAYQPLEFKPRELTVQEQAMILNQWAQSPQKSMRAIQEAEFGATMQQIIERLNRAEKRELDRAQEVAGVEFLEKSPEYNATPVNAKKLTEYLKEKQKPITTNNLVKAFKDLSATDETLLRKQEPEEQEEPNEPPAIIASNQGLPPSPTPQQEIDMEKFKKMSVKDMQAVFARVRRR